MQTVTGPKKRDRETQAAVTLYSDDEEDVTRNFPPRQEPAAKRGKTHKASAGKKAAGQAAVPADLLAQELNDGASYDSDSSDGDGLKPTAPVPSSSCDRPL